MNSDLQLLANVTRLRNGPEDITTPDENFIDVTDQQEKRKFREENS